MHPLPDSIPEQLRRVIRPGEKVLWVGEPSGREVIPSILFPIWIGIVLSGHLYFGGTIRLVGKVSLSGTVTLVALIVLFVILTTAFELYCRKSAFRAFTDTRILLFGGWNYSKIRAIDYNDIRDIEIWNGPPLCWLGLGRIKLRTTGIDWGSLRRLKTLPAMKDSETVFRVMRRAWLVYRGELPPSAMEWEPRL